MKNNIIGQEVLIKEVNRIFQIFKVSQCEVRPHFILTGGSGSGKSFTIKNLTIEHELGFLEVNAAQLTKEGTSGNSLSKALSPLLQMGTKPTVVFVDEFDKLFISGNSNDSAAHESTTGVQNEFLKVLESDTTSVFGDYGKYINAPTKNVLFIFAGAFNGEEDITLDRLREIGLKTEFLGRVGLVYNTTPLTLENLYTIIDKSELLMKYLELFKNVDREAVTLTLKDYIKKNYDMNTLGARLINTLIHQYFIRGGKLDDKQVKEISLHPINKCKKIGYKTKVLAQTNLNLLLKNKRWRKKTNQGRIYYCSECKEYHITSALKTSSFGSEFRNMGLFHKEKWEKLLIKDEQ